MKKLLKSFLNFWYRPLVMFYLKWERKYYYESLRLVVLPGVFHPGYFHSTLFMCETLASISLKNKNVLELGAGTGMLSIYCVKKGALATASDISWKAIINIDKNARWNRVAITILQSDLFKNIPKQKFDLILINPPYYKKNPKTDAERAWYCGENMEYFANLFEQIPFFITKDSTVLMVLSQDCDIHGIKRMAEANNLDFTLRTEKQFRFEKNFIFTIGLNKSVDNYAAGSNSVGSEKSERAIT